MLAPSSSARITLDGSPSTKTRSRRSAPSGTSAATC
jgi:hypothetical protein